MHAVGWYQFANECLRSILAAWLAPCEELSQLLLLSTRPSILIPHHLLPVRFACWMLFALKSIVRTVVRRSLGGCQGDDFGRCVAMLRW